jgi:capsid protein
VENEVRAWRLIAEAVSRGLIAQHPLLAWGVNLQLSMMLGCGLQPIVTLDHDRLGITAKQADAIGAQMEAVFNGWANSKYSTLNEVENFHSAVENALRRAFATGEMCLKFDWRPDTPGRFATKASLLETTRISRVGVVKAENGNRLIDGLEVNPDGRVVALHVLPYLPQGVYSQGPALYSANPVRVPTELGFGRPLAVFTVLDRQGPEVHHGISPISSAILSAIAADEGLSVSLRTAAARASVAFALETPATPEEAVGAMTGKDPGAVAREASKSAHPYAGVIQAMEWLSTVPIQWKPGKVSVLPPGTAMKYIGADPDGKQFEALNRAIVTNVARGLGLTYAQLTSDLAQESFSASRINNQAPWDLAIRRRERSVVPLYAAAFENVVEEAINDGRIKLPRGADLYGDREGWLNAVEWAGPVAPTLDPSKDTAADVEGLAAGITSRAEIAKRKGTDWRVVMRQLAAEKALAEELGLNLETAQVQLAKANPPTTDTPALPAPKRKTTQ